MRVPSCLGLEPHLDGEERKESEHHDHTWHSWILFREERWKTGIAKRGKGCWDELIGGLVSHCTSEFNHGPTWTNAVATRTPVPKCLQKKMTG